jgi:hypothetical protein
MSVEQRHSSAEEFHSMLETIRLDEAQHNLILEGRELGVLTLKHLSNLPLLSKILSRIPVAKHEVGHSSQALSEGYHVLQESVIREGNTLGFVLSIPGKISPMSTFLKERARIALGGFVGEEKSHLSHEGCGSDLGQVSYLAHYHELITGMPARKFISEQLSRTRNHLHSISSQIYLSNVWDLAMKGRRV